MLSVADIKDRNSNFSSLKKKLNLFQIESTLTKLLLKEAHLMFKPLLSGLAISLLICKISYSGDYESYKENKARKNPLEYQNYPSQSYPPEGLAERDEMRAFYQYEVLEDFEKPSSWEVGFSADRTHNYLDKKGQHEPSEKFIHWRTLTRNNIFNDINPPSKRLVFDQKGDNTILGIRGKFDSLSSHELYIKPKNTLYLPKDFRTISLWVFGMREDYKLLIAFRDYTGVVKEIDMGNLNFKGWKQVSRKFAPYHFKLNNYIEQPLELLYIKITNQTHEVKDKAFHIWLDDLGYSYLPKQSFDPSDILAHEFIWTTPTAKDILNPDRLSEGDAELKKRLAGDQGQAQAPTDQPAQ